MGTVERQDERCFGQVTGGSPGSPAQIPVTLAPASADTVTVQYATRDGTAVAATDYTATSGTLTIPASSTSTTISVPVVGDTTTEANETFTVRLSSPTNAALGTLVTGAVVSANQQIQALAAARGIPVLDLFRLSDLSLSPLQLGGVTVPSDKLFTPDQFHPGTILQGLLADFLASYILSHLMGTYFAVAGLVLGGAIFAFGSSRAALRALAQPEYTYYAT